MNKHVFRPVPTLLLAMLILSACSGTPAAPTPTVHPVVNLKVSGAGTITAVMEALQPAFEAATPGINLEVLESSSTGSGVKGILEGILDLASMSRPPKDEEASQNVKYFEMGLVGQAIIIHPSAEGVTSLNNQQIADIFLGKVTNWSEVGGPDLEIILYVRDPDDSSTKVLRKAIVGEIPFPETAQVMTSQGDMITVVEGTPGAIGIAAYPIVLVKEAKVLVVSVNGLQPNDPSYAMSESSGLGFMADRQNDVQPLLDWLSSADGQAALKALGFILPK